MKLSIVTCTDGNFLVRKEYSDRDSALIGYDNLHAALINEKSMAYGVIKILDENLDCYEGRMDVIKHEPQVVEPTPEPEPEPIEVENVRE